jgi:hypothetical protein
MADEPKSTSKATGSKTPEEVDPSTVSRDAQFSTYSDVTPAAEPGQPPPGKATEQTLGVPTES